MGAFKLAKKKPHPPKSSSKNQQPLFSPSDSFDTLIMKYSQEMNKVLKDQYNCPLCNQTVNGGQEGLLAHILGNPHNLPTDGS